MLHLSRLNGMNFDSLSVFSFFLSHAIFKFLKLNDSEFRCNIKGAICWVVFFFVLLLQLQNMLFILHNRRAGLNANLFCFLGRFENGGKTYVTKGQKVSTDI